MAHAYSTDVTTQKAPHLRLIGGLEGDPPRRAPGQTGAARRRPADSGGWREPRRCPSGVWTCAAYHGTCNTDFPMALEQRQLLSAFIDEGGRPHG